ncbi:cupin domain-containing protein [Streptomyces sp. NPDC046909]|uniref:JmjC domain-containing protein n=1 Tax=Streptomyces sp. NPDC046909 TaxID=3155617 RepID=UPI0033FC67A7
MPSRVRIVNTASLRQESADLVHLPVEAAALPFDRETLRRCTGDEKEFVADIWGKRAHITSGGIPDEDLIGVEDVDRLLSDIPLLRAEMIRLVRDGEILPRTSYLRSVRDVYPRPADLEMTENEHLLELLTRGAASAAEVTAAVRGGATLILENAHWYHPPLTAFCRALELALGHRCRANVYLSPVSAQGFDLHTDRTDVFVLQAFGEKHWHLEATPWQRAHGLDPEVTDPVLRPGDVLYIPRGTPHRAYTKSARSGHVTISVTPNAWRDVLRASLTRLVEQSLPAELLDAELPVGWLHDPAATAGPAERFTQAVGAAVAGQEPDGIRTAHLLDFLTGLTDRIPGAYTTDQALGVLGVTDTTRLRRRRTVPCALFTERSRERLYVVLGRRTLVLPGRYTDVVCHLAALDAFRPEDFSSFGLDAMERRELCQALVDTHLLVSD